MGKIISKEEFQLSIANSIAIKDMEKNETTIIEGIVPVKSQSFFNINQLINKFKEDGKTKKNNFSDNVISVHDINEFHKRCQ